MLHSLPPLISRHDRVHLHPPPQLRTLTPTEPRRRRQHPEQPLRPDHPLPVPATPTTPPTLLRPATPLRNATLPAHLRPHPSLIPPLPAPVQHGAVLHARRRLQHGAVLHPRPRALDLVAREIALARREEPALPRGPGTQDPAREVGRRARAGPGRRRRRLSRRGAGARR